MDLVFGQERVCAPQDSQRTPVGKGCGGFKGPTFHPTFRSGSKSFDCHVLEGRAIDGELNEDGCTLEVPQSRPGSCTNYIRFMCIL